MGQLIRYSEQRERRRRRQRSAWAVPLCALGASLILHHRAATRAAAEDRAGEQFTFVDHILLLPFEPKAAYLLREESLGRVSQYPAVAVEYPRSKNQQQPKGQAGAEQAPANSTKKRYALGAAISSGSMFDGIGAPYTFFLSSLNKEFAATEVKVVSADDMNSSHESLNGIKAELEQVGHEIESAQLENDQLESTLTNIRGRVSELADVDSLIDLKSELQDLKSFDEQRNEELSHLQTLVDAASDSVDPPAVTDLYLTLSSLLRTTAKKTALAERLSVRKKEEAIANFKRKLTLAKEMDSSDPELLAQEALRLRRIRTDLERQLGQSPADPGASADF